MPLAAAQGALGYPRYGYTTLPKNFGFITVIEDLHDYTVYATPISIGKNKAINVPYYYYDTETADDTFYSAIAKLDGYGVPSFIEKYRSGTDYTGYAEHYEFYDSVVDSANSTICIGRFKYYTYNKYCAMVVKINEDGSLAWSEIIQSDNSTTNEIRAVSISIDSSNNIYVVTQEYVGGSGQPTNSKLTKLNSSGTKQWGYSITNIRAITVDSSGNVYAIKKPAVGNTILDKISSSGANVWSYTISGGVTPNYFPMATNGTYIATMQDNGYVIFNNAGTILRKNAVPYVLNISGIDYGLNVIDIQMDIYGWVYLLASVNISGTYQTYIFGFDSSDTLIFSNKLIQVDGSFEPKGLTYFKGDLYVSGHNNTNSAIYSVKLPSYGLIPGTGNYQVTVDSNTYTFQLTSESITTHTSSFILTAQSPTYTVSTISNIVFTSLAQALTIDYGVVEF